MKKQCIASGVLALCMTAAMLPVNAQAARLDRFQDIPKDSWYYEAVDHVVAKGYYKGLSTYEFAPDAEMTRAMFVTVLSRYADSAYKNSQSAYVDVPVSTWYTGAVNWAAYHKIVEGKGSGRFDPEGSVTREEMCAIIDRYLTAAKVKLKKQNGTVDFKDESKISSWAEDAVERCVEYGLVSGYPDGTFQPKATATRAQVAEIMYRLSVLADGGTIIPSGSTAGKDDDDDNSKPSGGNNGGSADKDEDEKPSGGNQGGNSGNEGDKPSGGETDEPVILAGDLTGLGMNKAAELVEEKLGGNNTVSAASVYDYVQKSAKTGAFTVKSTAELKEDLTSVMLMEAAETVSVVMALTTGEELSEKEIEKSISLVASELGVPVGRSDAADVAKALSARTAGLGEAIYQELRGYKEGYPFASILVEDAYGAVLYTVEPSTHKTSLSREDMAAVLAQKMALQLQESLRGHTTATEKLDLSAKLTMRFDLLEDAALAECTDEVSVDCALKISGDGSVKYYYADATDHLVTRISAQDQEEYDTWINGVLQSALEERLEDVDTKLPAGLDVKVLLTGENIRALVNGTYDVLYDDIDYVVGNVLTEKQFNDALEDAGFDIQLGEVVDTLENTSIPSAVRKTIKNQMVNAAVIAVQSKVDGTDYEDAVTNKVAKYMVLTALDGVAQREHDSDCFASDAASAKKSAVDSGEMAGLIDQIREEPQMVKAIEAAEPFQDLLTFDSLHDMYFEDLAEVLEVKAVAAAIDAQKEAGLMEDITAAFSAVPEGATVTIGGKKLSERQVKAMKEADTTKEARLAAIDALDTLGKLSMSSFADGLDVTMEAPGNSYTLNMTILAD